MPTCTRKTYRAIAGILARSHKRDEIARMIADWFERDNPKFRRVEFLKACGVKDKK